MKTHPTDAQTSSPATRTSDESFPDIFHSLERWLVILFLFGVMVVSAPVAFGQQNTLPPQTSADQQVVTQLLDAISKGDHRSFVSQGTPQFAGIDPAEFSRVSAAMAGRLQQGYFTEYLGTLRQQGLDISIWKIRFKDQGDDLLATLNVHNGQVGGFFLR